VGYKEPIGYEAQLAAQLYNQDDLQTSILGETDPAFGLRLEFISF